MWVRIGEIALFLLPSLPPYLEISVLLIRKGLDGRGVDGSGHVQGTQSWREGGSEEGKEDGVSV